MQHRKRNEIASLDAKHNTTYRLRNERINASTLRAKLFAFSLTVHSKTTRNER